MRLITWVLLLLAAAHAGHAAAAPRLPQPGALSTRAIDAGSGELAVSVHLHERPVVLQLLPQRRMEADFAPFAPKIAAGEDGIYAGAIIGVPASWARMTRIGGRWVGVVFDGLDLWYLKPAMKRGGQATPHGAAVDAAFARRIRDGYLAGGFDHGAWRHRAPAAMAPTPAKGAGSPVGAPRYLKLTLVLDTEFQSRYGADAAATAAALLNIADGLYRAQTDVQLSLHHLRALDDNGPLTSTDTGILLQTFTGFMRTSGIPFSGAAHLLSGKDFDGPLVGRSWTGSVCNDRFGFAIVQATGSTAFGGVALAHELGHNLGAFDDSNDNDCPSSGFVMANPFGAGAPPTGLPPAAFSACSLAYFNTFLAAPRACLDDPPPAEPALFVDGFEP